MMLNKAIEIAIKVHDWQVDKAGQPYIGHPLRVMAMGTTDEEKIVGVLHDVVEDSELVEKVIIVLEQNTPLPKPRKKKQ